MNPPARILVVEDEPDIAALVAFHLAREGYRVRTAATGEEALASVESERPDLVVLDLMLPGGLSGWDVLRSLRARPEWAEVPVIVLTARGAEEDRLTGFRAGADDYVAKPFSPPELVLRVGAVLRRAPPSDARRVLRVGPVALDLEARRVTVDGRPVELTPTELRLLQVLLERRGRVQSRQQLLQAAWGVRANLESRTVDMHVLRLRQKLGPAAGWIETVRGFGYRFRTEPPR
jgi:two-component system phosphate regulon response regulator PhoB